ncbi:MAG: RNA degradosome polyphosphate kinase [Cellulomonas sp.]|uniref:Polyphosphate kinase n=1 Tax=Cellulomonas gelida TaxID=1712 RepID=A0A4Y3KLC7_9CELL|nr:MULTISPECIES: RNA degradosome polyphosphate kinase [Cellulomonas]KMM44762.1 polyphosphate kinase [Cellulomonas sp. A375-1]MCR6648480.1 RNA degradosome polyphosphate kinase [Cellulomonas sp.]MCR6704432.1 RNA degradosome polyphosphate kinase [Cellulomonas sp.]GEA83760.1 polyphosphate kinase [Cellulomonas gelida]GGL31886.1 polyphosphate kinase [Cellulomonas gelida]
MTDATALDSELEDRIAEHLARADAAVPSVELEPLPHDRFLDRELSWLAFNQRVLELAEDVDLPLLERVRYLAIFASNLDEFFMVRVAGLKRRIATGIAVTAASGLSPRQVLEAISEKAHELMDRHARVFVDHVQPALASEGITLVRWQDLGESEQDRLRKFFKRQIFPVLTPLAVDPAHPFPYISGLSLNLAVVVVNPVTGKEHFARVKVPPLLPRFIAVDASGRPSAPDEQTASVEKGPTSFVPVEDVISEHLDHLFPGMEVREHHTFRVTRNEDVEVEEDDAENLLKAMEKELLRRRFGPPVRLEIAEGISPRIRTLLVRELGMAEDEVYELPAPLDHTGLNVIADLDRSSLQFPRFVPTTHRQLAEVESATPTEMFAKIRERDILLHHPYDSFSTSVQTFLEQAAADPNVLAIKQTLYRTSGDSPIVDALIDAAEAGKQVLALVEIKARFDEQNNISWARKLEQAGVHVVYGIVGLKTHCKLSLVVRQEADGLRRYSHVGTGNYHPKTARLYTDLGLLTSDPDVGQDLTRLFNQLSGYAPKSRFHRLLVAPRSVRTGLVERIDREAEAALAGQPAWIKIKVNSMVDEATIDALYRASQAGVPVDLVVRGICALRPGVPGLSETIRVRSILGRFLEHSRVFAFAHAQPAPEDGFEGPEVFIGSADLMHRNLDRRVEALVRVADPDQVAEIVDLIDESVAPTTSSWHLEPDGSWQRHSRAQDGTPLLDQQSALITRQRRRPGSGL